MNKDDNKPVFGTMLTLKNLYRLLTQNDYPVYSLPVLAAKERKQLTLLTFWNDNLIYDFRSGPYGKMIWRSEGKTNRYLSYICNRSKTDFYSGYLSELLEVTDAAQMLEQMSRFRGFLQQHNYDRKIFRERCTVLPDALKAGDPLVSAALVSWLKTAMDETAVLPQADEETDIFRDCWFFTVLTVLALAGTELPAMAAVLMNREDLQPSALWEYVKSRDPKPKEVEILSIDGTELHSRPLPGSSFFGRETEMFELLEAVRSREKILLTGIGGIGKTELLRQLLQAVLQEKTVSVLAAIPFHGTLSESVAINCPQPGYSGDEVLHSLIFRLNRAESGKSLLLIDNVAASSLSEENVDALLSLKGAVILSSRDTSIRGFKPYAVGAVSPMAGELIYRSVFNAPMAAEERQTLRTMLEREPLRHTLALRALALTAKNKKLSVQQAFFLFPEVHTGQELTAITDDKIFRQLYRVAELTKEEKTITHLFALLPYITCSEEELLAWFPQILTQPAILHSALTCLNNGGWMEASSNGWAMHPVIAGILRKKSYSEAELSPFLQNLTAWNGWQNGAYEYSDLDDDREKYVARSIAGLAKGKLSRSFLQNYLMLSSRRFFPKHRQTGILEWLYRQISACPDADSSLLMLLCCWNNGMTLPETIFKQMIALTESDRKQDFLHTEFLETLSRTCLLSGQIEEARHLLSLSIPAQQDAYNQLHHLNNEFLLFELTSDSALLGDMLENIRKFPISEGLPEAVAAGYTYTKVETLLLIGNPEVFDLIPELKKKIAELQPGYCRRLIESALFELLFYSCQYEDTIGILKQLIDYAEEYEENISAYSLKRNYAVCLSKTGRAAEAAEIYEELLSCSEMKAMSEQWNTLQQNYAMLLIDMGRAAEALPMLENLLALYEDKEGPARANMLRSLAICCRALKKRKAAKEYLCRALPEIRACYGAEHPRTAEMEAMAAELGVDIK